MNDDPAGVLPLLTFVAWAFAVIFPLVVGIYVISGVRCLHRIEDRIKKAGFSSTEEDRKKIIKQSNE